MSRKTKRGKEGARSPPKKKRTADGRISTPPKEDAGPGMEHRFRSAQKRRIFTPECQERGGEKLPNAKRKSARKKRKREEHDERGKKKRTAAKEGEKDSSLR